MLDKTTVGLLNYISKKTSVTDADIRSHYHKDMYDSIRLLISERYISVVDTVYDACGLPVSHSYSINADGRAYIEHQKIIIIKEMIGIVLSAGVIAATLFSGCQKK